MALSEEVKEPGLLYVTKKDGKKTLERVIMRSKDKIGVLVMEGEFT